MCLNSIHVPSHPSQVSRLASYLSIQVVSQSGSLCLHFTSILVTFNLHPGPQSCISAPSKHNLKPIQFSRCASHLIPSLQNCIWGPPSQHFKLILVKMYVSTPCRSCLTWIQISGYLYHLLPSIIWPQSRSLDPHPTSTSWCQYSCLTSSQAVSHLHPSLKICGSLPYRFPINLIQVWRCKVSLPLCPHFHPGPVDSHLTSIQAVSNTYAGPDICVSPQPMWRLS